MKMDLIKKLPDASIIEIVKEIGNQIPRLRIEYPALANRDVLERIIEESFNYGVQLELTDDGEPRIIIAKDSGKTKKSNKQPELNFEALPDKSAEEVKVEDEEDVSHVDIEVDLTNIKELVEDLQAKVTELTERIQFVSDRAADAVCAADKLMKYFEQFTRIFNIDAINSMIQTVCSLESQSYSEKEENSENFTAEPPKRRRGRPPKRK